MCSLPPWPLTSRVTVVRGWKREFAPQWKSFFHGDGGEERGRRIFEGERMGGGARVTFVFIFIFTFYFFERVSLSLNFRASFRSLSIPVRVSSVYRIVYAGLD